MIQKLQLVKQESEPWHTFFNGYGHIELYQSSNQTIASHLSCLVVTYLNFSNYSSETIGFHEFSHKQSAIPHFACDVVHTPHFNHFFLDIFSKVPYWMDLEVFKTMYQPLEPPFQQFQTQIKEGNMERTLLSPISNAPAFVCFRIFFRNDLPIFLFSTESLYDGSKNQDNTRK